jgi:hypothetical protein
MPSIEISVKNNNAWAVEVLSTPLLGGRYGLGIVLPVLGEVPPGDAPALRRAAAHALRQAAMDLEEPLRVDYAAIARRAGLYLVPRDEGTD